jgi:DNA modification methylase
METRGLHKVRKDVISCLRAKAIDSLSDPLPSQLGMAMMKDARKLPIEDESVDMIFTSPPYFEMQTYARDNWLRLWFLGYDHNEVKKWQMRTSSRERFLEFMRDCMQEMYRVLKDDSSCFVVIGDVTCNDHVVNGSNLLAKVSKNIGFKVDRIIVDSVPRAHKYFMFIPRSQGIRRDRIIELHKGRVRERDTDPGWDDPYRGHLKR